MPTYPDDADGAVLAELAARGVDMTQPLLIEFAVAVPDEASAERTQQSLAQAGYAAHIEYDEGEPDENGDIDPDDEEFGPAWTVFADVEMVPAYDEVIRVQQDLDRLAQPFGGFADGWGVMLETDEEE